MGVLDREFLGMGANVQQFELALSAFFGRPAVCVVNGTAALQLALQAAGIGPGDEVLVQSLTYVASFQAIAATGARPVACEVDPHTLTLDWRDAERRVTSRTRAVMPVHYAGGVGDLDGILGFAEKYKLRVVEDAAHALGTMHGKRRVGSFGDIACFSFDGIKNITSGEGGCIVTSDPAVLARARDGRLLGVLSDTEQRYAGGRSWTFDVTMQGWRYHMSNIMAAIGVVQLGRLPDLAARRGELARRYDEAFKGHPRIQSLPLDYACVAPHIYVVRIKGLTDRDLLRERLLGEGIQTGVHYQPGHTLSYFQDASGAWPVTDSVYPELLTLPLHPELSSGDIDRVCAQLCNALGGIPLEPVH